MSDVVRSTEYGSAAGEAGGSMSEAPDVNRRSQKWIVIASFFDKKDDRWLDDFIDDSGLTFSKIPPPGAAPDWHVGRSRITPIARWVRHFWHAKAAFHGGPDGIITCFPQLAFVSALWKRVGRSKPRLIAYNFNLGELRPGLPQRIARMIASQIDLYVVHSPEEVQRYSNYLDIAPARLKFIPLQRGEIGIPRVERAEAPFIVAMGSAHRDYPSLIKAVDRLEIPTIIVTRASDIPGLPESPHVTFRSNMSEQECLELMAQARICVTPIANLKTASGQVTFINAMQLGVAVVATRCPGTEGYITHGSDGLLVEPFDVDDLANAIDLIWNDATYRDTLAENGRTTSRERFSDEKAARQLHGLIRAAHVTPSLQG